MRCCYVDRECKSDCIAWDRDVRQCTRLTSEIASVNILSDIKEQLSRIDCDLENINDAMIMR